MITHAKPVTNSVFFSVFPTDIIICQCVILVILGALFTPKSNSQYLQRRYREGNMTAVMPHLKQRFLGMEFHT